MFVCHYNVYSHTIFCCLYSPWHIVMFVFQLITEQKITSQSPTTPHRKPVNKIYIKCSISQSLILDKPSYTRGRGQSFILPSGGDKHFYIKRGPKILHKGDKHFMSEVMVAMMWVKRTNILWRKANIFARKMSKLTAADINPIYRDNVVTPKYWSFPDIALCICCIYDWNFKNILLWWHDFLVKYRCGSNLWQHFPTIA